MSARPNPFDLLFAGELEQKLAEVHTESESRGVDVHDRDRVSGLLAVGAVLRELVPEGTPAAAMQQVANLVFYCFHFWAAGKPVFEIAEPDLRRLLDADFVAASDVAAPAPAGYVMLPRNRVWSRIEESSHAEAVDGFFFAGRDVLLILGLLPGRPGFSIMDVRDETGGDFVHTQARADGDDFANVLPGGEIQGHFAVTNQAEVLKLAHRCFAHLSAHG